MRRRRVRLASSGWTQFRLLLRRSFREVARSRGVLAIKVVQQVAISLIYGSIYTVGNSQVREGAQHVPIALPPRPQAEDTRAFLVLSSIRLSHSYSPTPS
jgi:hypothetical protein